MNKKTNFAKYIIRKRTDKYMEKALHCDNKQVRESARWFLNSMQEYKQYMIKLIKS